MLNLNGKHGKRSRPDRTLKFSLFFSHPREKYILLEILIFNSGRSFYIVFNNVDCCNIKQCIYLLPFSSCKLLLECECISWRHVYFDHIQVKLILTYHSFVKIGDLMMTCSQFLPSRPVHLIHWIQYVLARLFDLWVTREGVLLTLKVLWIE